MVMPAGVALTSLLSNADIDTFYDVFILYSAKADIPQSVIGRLSEEYSNVRITFRPVADEFEGAVE
ncbi:MAG: hypothetical protein J5835_04345, partial [Bacteroidales bacterium]|nr:hypothetical protein [Bacteroidales bacterium]